jgi:hypothetical protein
MLLGMAYHSALARRARSDSGDGEPTAVFAHDAVDVLCVEVAGLDLKSVSVDHLIDEAICGVARGEAIPDESIAVGGEESIHLIGVGVGGFRAAAASVFEKHL